MLEYSKPKLDQHLQAVSGGGPPSLGRVWVPASRTILKFQHGVRVGRLIRETPRAVPVHKRSLIRSPMHDIAKVFAHKLSPTAQPQRVAVCRGPAFGLRVRRSLQEIKDRSRRCWRPADESFHRSHERQLRRESAWPESVESTTMRTRTGMRLALPDLAELVRRVQCSHKGSRIALRDEPSAWVLIQDNAGARWSVFDRFIGL